MYMGASGLVGAFVKVKKLVYMDGTYASIRITYPLSNFSLRLSFFKLRIDCHEQKPSLRADKRFMHREIQFLESWFFIDE